MNVQTNVFLGLAFIAAVITNAYPSPLLSEGDEEKSQILFLAKLSNLIKARKQEMVRSAPHSSSSSSLLFNPFYPRGKTDQQKATNKLLKVREFLEMDRAKEDSMFVSPKLQEKALQQFFSRIMDTRARKGRHSNHKKYAKKKGEMAAAAAGEGRLQNYNKHDENAKKFLDGFFSCITKRLPDFLQSLKGTKIFGLPASTILNIFSGFTDKSGIKLYQGFINSLLHFIGGSTGKMSAKEQVFDFDLLWTIFKDVLTSFADSPRQEGESDDLMRHLLNVVSIVVNPTFGNATRFKDSINYVLENLIFHRIDNMEISEEEKNRRKDALRFAVNNVVDAIIVKEINHGELNPNNRNTLLRSIMTVLAYLNSVFSNRSLIQFVDQFLAENPTDEELVTKSQCLLVIFYHQVLEYVMNVFKMKLGDRNKTGLLFCTANLMQDAFNLLLEDIPKKVSNIGECEDFAMVGY